MRPALLTENERAEKLSVRMDWTYSDNFISRTFTFKTFTDAFAFMTRAAFEAEKLNHHPDWKNVYNRVEVTLNTHDAGGVTELDFKLAAAMDKIYSDGFR
jgi:4a-hydroxytetrahydrobiopterin dehydratase